MGWDGDEGGKVFGAVEVWGWGVDGKGGHVVWGIGAGGAFIEVSHEDVSGVCVDAWEGDVDGECPGAWVLIGGGTAKDVARDLGVWVGEKWAPSLARGSKFGEADAEGIAFKIEVAVSAGDKEFDA